MAKEKSKDLGKAMADAVLGGAASTVKTVAGGIVAGPVIVIGLGLIKKALGGNKK